MLREKLLKKCLLINRRKSIKIGERSTFSSVNFNVNMKITLVLFVAITLLNNYCTSNVLCKLSSFYLLLSCYLIKEKSM